MRIAVRLGGHDHEAILDTGANLSTISASAAKQAGIHLLPQALSVGSASQRALPMRLGIAPWVQLGTARLTNVVFIVLPDAALRFPHGYRINVIIGLPVLMALGQRLEIVNSGMPELLYDVPRATPADASTAPAQMLLCGPTLLLLVRLPGIRTPLPMTLDTGSDSTAFSHHALAAAPTAFAHARRHITHFGGAGGETAASGRLVPAATFIIGRHRFELKNVPLGSPAHASGYWKSDGNIGQNVLSQAARWTMNFKTMTLAVGN
jgi:hypothetical protein